jgi:hypothetical protein
LGDLKGAKMKKLVLLCIIISTLLFVISCVTKEVSVTETYYETEYKTEYKTETSTEIEDVVVSTSEGKTYLNPVSKWYAGIYFKEAGSGSGGTYYYGYKIDAGGHTRSTVKIVVSLTQGRVVVCNLTNRGQFPSMPTTVSKWRDVNPKTGELFLTQAEQTWLDDLNSILTNQEYNLGYARESGEISFDTTGIEEFGIFANTWNAYTVSSVKLVWSDDVIEKRNVTKERQVSYQVPVQVEKQRTVIQTKKVPFWEAIFH